MKEYKDLTKEIKRRILEIACQTQSHHIGSCLSMADFLTVLYFRTLNINPKRPQNINRDRLILSKGHACLALYTVLAKKGFFSEKKLLENYSKDGGRLGMHPDKDALPGIEATSGSLGHGLSVGAGLAYTAKLDNSSSRAFVILGDGECNEGSIWEAAMFSSQHNLDNLIAIVDYNHLQGFGRTEEVIDLEPLADKWQSFGWSVREMDGHNIEEIVKTFDNIPFKKNQPNLIIAKTIKGKGVSFLEDKLESHYACISEEELKQVLKEL